MLFSSPDMINTSLMCTEVIDIDVLEDNCCAACGEYAKDIFSYLRESEVKTTCMCFRAMNIEGSVGLIAHPTALHSCVV